MAIMMKTASGYQTIEHNFEPVFNARSQVLILGSLPSVKSRQNNFYYGHPQNRFWKLIAALCHAEVPQTIEEKKKLLCDHGIAVWDVIAKCDIVGSSDSTIRNVVPNDMRVILENAPINRIYANAAFSMERLIMVWSGLI